MKIQCIHNAQHQQTGQRKGNGGRQGAWQISADALLSRCGKPGACGEAADILRRAFDRRQLQKLTDLFRRYCGECQYNVGVGHVLGALGAELAQTLAL